MNHRQTVNKLPTDWLLYEEMTRTHLVSQIKACTVISAVTVALFAGPAKLPQDTVKGIEESCTLRGQSGSRASGRAARLEVSQGQWHRGELHA